MSKHIMIIAVALVTGGGCSDKGDTPADQPTNQLTAAKDDQRTERDVVKPSTFEVSNRREGTAVVTMTVPDGWVDNERIRIGKGWKAAEADDVWLTVVLDCAGTCDPAQIRDNVQPIVAAKRNGYPHTGPSQPSADVDGVEQEVIDDAVLEGGHLIVRRFTPPKEVMDPPKPMLEVFCYRHNEGMPVYVAVTGKGPVEQAGPYQSAMIEACRSLEIAEWKPEK